MKNFYDSLNDETKEITDPLQEADMNAYQKSLEQQAENLQNAGNRRVRQEQQRAQEQQRIQEAQIQQQTEGSVRYEKGYYDGYADALDEINERLAAEEEDEYDFGRHYSGKDRKKKKRVVYEDAYGGEEEIVVRKKRKKHRGHPVLTTIIVLIILLLVGAFFLARALFGRVTRVDPVADQAADAHASANGVVLTKDPAVKNILLIGSDARETDGSRQRSDSMILCSINTNTGTITLTSFLRDMYVPIPDYGSDKLNAAYAYGDMLLLDETIQEDFGIDINGNAVVDFDGFIRALTAVGNINIELTQEEADYLNGGGWEDQGMNGNDGTWNLQAGMNSLTPAQALAYCRIRYIGNSDWERTERQRKVVMAAFTQFKRSNPITQYRVVSNALSSVTTDMSDMTLLSLLFRALLLRNSEIENYLIPVDGTFYIDYIDGMDVLVPDLEQNRSYLREYIYG